MILRLTEQVSVIVSKSFCCSQSSPEWRHASTVVQRHAVQQKAIRELQRLLVSVYIYIQTR